MLLNEWARPLKGFGGQISGEPRGGNQFSIGMTLFQGRALRLMSRPYSITIEIL